MSLALESLMQREAPIPTNSRRSASLLAFLVIGGGAALAFVIVSAVAVPLFPNARPGVVSALCYAAFIVPVYLLQRQFSFRSGSEHREALPRYVVVQMGALFFASVFGQLLHGALGLPSLAASILVIGLTSGVNFLVLRNWAFEPKPAVAVAPDLVRDGLSIPNQ